jgi:hypothetical protein
MIISFNLKIDFLNVFGIFAGSYFDFSVEWYRKIGASLSMTLLINIVSPHAAKIAMPLLVALKRCRDRGWKSSYHPTDGSSKPVTK